MGVTNHLLTGMILRVHSQEWPFAFSVCQDSFVAHSGPGVLLERGRAEKEKPTKPCLCRLCKLGQSLVVPYTLLAPSKFCLVRDCMPNLGLQKNEIFIYTAEWWSGTLLWMCRWGACLAMLDLKTNQIGHHGPQVRLHMPGLKMPGLMRGRGHVRGFHILLHILLHQALMFSLPIRPPDSSLHSHGDSINWHNYSYNYPGSGNKVVGII